MAHTSWASICWTRFAGGGEAIFKKLVWGYYYVASIGNCRTCVSQPRHWSMECGFSPTQPLGACLGLGQCRPVHSLVPRLASAVGLGGLFPNFHLLCYTHIPENTLYYSLNFPLLAIPNYSWRTCSIGMQNSPTKKLHKKYIKFHNSCTASSQNLPVKHCITTATSALERSILSTILSRREKLPMR